MRFHASSAGLVQVDLLTSRAAGDYGPQACCGWLVRPGKLKQATESRWVGAAKTVASPDVVSFAHAWQTRVWPLQSNL